MASKSREATLTKHGRWAELPPQLLQGVIDRVEAGEAARPVEKGRPGQRVNPSQCFIKGEQATGTYHLSLALGPANGEEGEGHEVLQGENEKILLAPCKIKHATSTDFVISLVSDDFSKTITAYVGTLRSNFLGIKFTVYDSQPPSEAAILSKSCSNQRFNSKQISPRAPDGNYRVDTIKLNVLQIWGPRRMQRTLHSIPNSAVQKGGTAPTPCFLHFLEKQFSVLSVSKPNDLIIQFSSTSLTDAPGPVQTLAEP